MAQTYGQAFRTLVPGSDNQCLKLKAAIDKQINESQELIIDLATLAGDYADADAQALLAKYNDKVVYVVDQNQPVDSEGDVPVKGIPITDIIRWQLNEIDETDLTYENALYQISEAKESLIAMSLVLEANASAYANSVASTAMERAQAITGLIQVHLQGASDAAKSAAASLVSKISNTEFNSDAIFNAVSQFLGSAKASKEGYITTSLTFDATGCTAWSYLVSSVATGWNNFVTAVGHILDVIGNAVKSIAQHAIGFTRATIDVLTGKNDSFTVSDRGDPVITNSGFTYVQSSDYELPQGVIHHTLPGSDVYTYRGTIADYYTEPGGTKAPFYGLIARRVPRFINPKYVENWVKFAYKKTNSLSDAYFALPVFSTVSDADFFEKVRLAIQGSVDWVPTTEAEMRDSLILSRGLDVLALTAAGIGPAMDISNNLIIGWLGTQPESGSSYSFLQGIADASSALSVSSDTNYQEWATPHADGYDDLTNKDVVILSCGGEPSADHWNDPFYWTRRQDVGSYASKQMVNRCIWAPSAVDYQFDDARDVFNVLPFIRFPSGRIDVMSDKQILAVTFSFVCLTIVAAATTVAATSTILVKRKLREAKIIQGATERDLTKGLMSDATRKQAVKAVKKAQRKVTTLTILAGAAAGGMSALATNVQNVVATALNSATLTSVGNISANTGISDVESQTLPTISDVMSSFSAQQQQIDQLQASVNTIITLIRGVKP